MTANLRPDIDRAFSGPEAPTYPFPKVLLDEPRLTDVWSTLHDLERRFQLSDDHRERPQTYDKIQRVTAEFLRFCSPPSPDPVALRAVCALTYLAIHIGDQIGVPGHRRRLEDMARQVRGEAMAPRRPATRLTRALVNELTALEGFAADRSHDFFNEFLQSLWAVLWIAEHRSGGPDRRIPSVDHYLFARRRSIFALPYIAIWRLTTGFSADPSWATDLRHIENVVAEVIALANDLFSVERDAAENLPNLVTILAGRRSLPVALAAHQVKDRHDRAVERWMELDRALRRRTDDLALRGYLNFLQTLVSGNLATMEVLKRRYVEPCLETSPRRRTGDDALRLAAGARFLEQQWRKDGDALRCFTSSERDFANVEPVAPEWFSAISVLEASADVALPAALRHGLALDLHRSLDSRSVVHFFDDQKRLPADVDCTALGLLTLRRAGLLTPAVAELGLRKVVANTDADGVICVYVDAEPERRNLRDPVVCANALQWIHHQDWGVRARATEDFVWQALVAGRCAEGTRYYPSEATFWFRVAQLVDAFPHFERFRAPLVERLGPSHDSGHLLEVAHRALARAHLGLPCRAEIERLRSEQRPDGSWAPDAYYRYGRSEIYFGSTVLSTSFCLWALARAQV